MMSKLHDSADNNNLKFEYVDPTKDVSFYEYMSIELFNVIKNNQIKFSELKNKQKDFLKKLNELKIGNRNAEQIEVINNINKSFNSRKEAINFFRGYIEMLSDANYNEKQGGEGLKILTPKQMLQRLPTALAQVKAGNNSESLLNEIMQNVYSLYQSKQITKKVYNNIIKSI